MNAKYVSGENAYLGKVRVGSIHYNGIDRDKTLRYVANTTLPTISGLPFSTIGKFPTEDEARKKVEETVEQWLANISE